jgi:hypothetical protein
MATEGGAGRRTATCVPLIAVSCLNAQQSSTPYLRAPPSLSCLMDLPSGWASREGWWVGMLPSGGLVALLLLQSS